MWQKNHQAIKKASRLTMKIRKWNQFNQFRWRSTKVVPVEIFNLTTLRQWAKCSNEAASEPNSLTYPFLELAQLTQVTTGSTSSDMRILFYARSFGRFLEIKGYRFIKINGCIRRRILLEWIKRNVLNES